MLAAVEREIERLVEPDGRHPVQVAAAEAARGGKLLRPRLIIAAAGGQADEDAVVAVSAALELLHTALLVHDDVIDGDDARRGRPSVARAAADDASAAGMGAGAAQRLGLVAGVVTGDALLVRALTSLARIAVDDALRRRVLAIVDRAMLHAAEGEHDDVRYAGGVPEERDIERILEGKTADYSFRAPLEIGAVLAGRPEPVVEELGRIGMQMGIVFQLRDDVLGVFGDEAVTGKSTMSDIRAGAPTLLSKLASASEQWAPVAATYGDDSAAVADGDRVRAAMRDSGALDEVERRIAERVERTRERIRALDVEAGTREALERLLVRCAERQR